MNSTNRTQQQLEVAAVIMLMVTLSTISTDPWIQSSIRSIAPWGFLLSLIGLITFHFHKNYAIDIKRTIAAATNEEASPIAATTSTTTTPATTSTTSGATNPMTLSTKTFVSPTNHSLKILHDTLHNEKISFQFKHKAIDIGHKAMKQPQADLTATKANKSIVKSPITTIKYNSKSTATQKPKDPKKRTVLVTGGAGYIGSHTVLELVEAHSTKQDNDEYYEIVVVDNLVNSVEESLHRVQEITKCDKNRIYFRKCDIRDRTTLGKVLDEFPNITSCIHFAGLKAVGESVQKPLEYYDNNVNGTIVLLQMLYERGIGNFVFSSSATVYGEPETLPITEQASISATNPYGRTKLFIEEMLRDAHKSHPDFWNILLLRYFNPIGAHPSGIIGEDPRGHPNNLMPYLAQVCVGRRKQLQVFGNDYNTVDGTGVRDYIHVVDLAKGHVAALERLYTNNNNNNSSGGCHAINLGTGHGVSVLELVQGMNVATQRTIPYEIVGRRPGDVAEIYADPTFAKEYLHWEAKLNVTDMCTDTWRWQSRNPYGYNNTTK